MKTTRRSLIPQIAIALSLAMMAGSLPAAQAEDPQKPASDASRGTDRTARREKLRKWLLEKFDKNHNGRLDPEEREAMKKAFQERRAKRGLGKGAASGSRQSGTDSPAGGQ
jgi:hypothetical protein